MLVSISDSFFFTLSQTSKQSLEIILLSNFPLVQRAQESDLEPLLEDLS